MTTIYEDERMKIALHDEPVPEGESRIFGQSISVTNKAEGGAVLTLTLAGPLVMIGSLKGYPFNELEADYPTVVTGPKS